jgi:V/A-type H+/Na+-transporting ATPase subunit E
VRRAEEEAAAIRQQAEADAAAFVERGRRALEQAARDVVLLVGQSVTAAFTELTHRQVEHAFTPDVLKAMLASVVDAYFKSHERAPRIDIFLSPEQQKALADYLLAGFSEEVRRGMVIKPSPVLAAGLRVRVVEENVEHDLTAEAITAALSELVRPYLADIVRRGAASAGLNVADKPRA